MNSEEDTPSSNQNFIPPASQPAIPNPPSTESSKPTVSAGLIILQWLTYAFWGWTLLALSGLTNIVISNLIEKNDTATELLPYVLAASIVLLIIVLPCDFFYRKKEVSKKQGASMVVMIIHAVIFALFGIGALIGGVFALIQLLIATNSYSGAMSSFISLLIITVLYGFAFLRTLNPFHNFNIGRWFSISMLSVAGIFIVLSIVGPLAQATTTKNDRRLEANLADISQAVESYTSNNKLPATLSDLELGGEAGRLISDNLVEYKIDDAKLFRYQLCVTYQQKHGENSENHRTSYDDNNGYDSYLSNYDHPAGKVCYKLQTTYSTVNTDQNPSVVDKTETSKSQLENVKYYLSYYGNHGSGEYPTKAQWDSETFRKKFILVDEKVLSKVTYSPDGCDTGGCTSFTISMQDENDKTISLSNSQPGSY